jgi:hypothetical protein
MQWNEIFLVSRKTSNLSGRILASSFRQAHPAEIRALSGTDKCTDWPITNKIIQNTADVTNDIVAHTYLAPP